MVKNLFILLLLFLLSCEGKNKNNYVGSISHLRILNYLGEKKLDICNCDKKNKEIECIFLKKLQNELFDPLKKLIYLDLTFDSENPKKRPGEILRTEIGNKNISEIMSFKDFKNVVDRTLIESEKNLNENSIKNFDVYSYLISIYTDESKLGSEEYFKTLTIDQYLIENVIILIESYNMIDDCEKVVSSSE
ncbi:hypothetical protein HZR84_14340 [Hyphobacterium sp. CCMP332]|nr:hypothetical protein HZR84_14340 [Hyphobacterium sp. CCMP332]